MNKIIIDKEDILVLDNNVVLIDIRVDNVVLNIKGDVVINEVKVINRENLNLTINLEENSSLIYNRFIKNKNMNNNIIIKQKTKSKVIFNYSIIATDIGQLEFKSILDGNHNETEVNIRAITEEKGKLKLACTSETKEKTQENNLIEDIRILLLNNEESIIIPDLLVSSNEVEVNHAATMSGIKNDELFYLESKGLSEQVARDLIKNGFVIGNLMLQGNFKEEIKELIGR